MSEMIYGKKISLKHKQVKIFLKMSDELMQSLDGFNEFLDQDKVR